MWTQRILNPCIVCSKLATCMFFLSDLKIRPNELGSACKHSSTRRSVSSPTVPSWHNLLLSEQLARQRHLLIDAFQFPFLSCMLSSSMRITFCLLANNCSFFALKGIHPQKFTWTATTPFDLRRCVQSRLHEHVYRLICLPNKSTCIYRTKTTDSHTAHTGNFLQYFL